MRFLFCTRQKILFRFLSAYPSALWLGWHRRIQWKKEWEKSVQEAEKEGIIVVGIPAPAELRKNSKQWFKPKFGIEWISRLRGDRRTRSKIAAEFAAGVKIFDVFIGGSGTYSRCRIRHDRAAGWQ